MQNSDLNSILSVKHIKFRNEKTGIGVYAINGFRYSKFINIHYFEWQDTVELTGREWLLDCILVQYNAKF